MNSSFIMNLIIIDILNSKLEYGYDNNFKNIFFKFIIQYKTNFINYLYFIIIKIKDLNLQLKHQKSKIQIVNIYTIKFI